MQKSSRTDYWAPGDWNAICSMCGRKRKASTMVRNWQGLWRCPEHNEPRHPQDFVQGRVEQPAPPWVQPPPEDVFTYVCDVNSQSAIPGYAGPGCSIPGTTGLV